MRFKKPKNGHYTCYCYGCKHYAFERQVGCAYIGTCSAIEGEPTEADAYDPPLSADGINATNVVSGSQLMKHILPSFRS